MYDDVLTLLLLLALLCTSLLLLLCHSIPLNEIKNIWSNDRMQALAGAIYHRDYYNNNKERFRNYYLKKRIELLNQPNIEVKQKEATMKRPTKKKKCKTITVQRGEFIVSWD